MQEEKSRHKKAFEEFARRVKNKLDESIQRLMLYGSVARGEEEEKSDVDVLLVLKYKDEEVKEEIISIAYDVLMEREGVHFTQDSVQGRVSEVEILQESFPPYCRGGG